MKLENYGWGVQGFFLGDENVTRLMVVRDAQF